MSFIKKMGNFEDEKKDNFSQEELSDFKKNVKYSYDNKIWIVSEEIESSSEHFRRVRCVDSPEDEIYTLKTLKEIETEDSFSFIK